MENGLEPVKPFCSSWISDSEYEECMECEHPFTFLNRRHHCRWCGRLLCDSCSSARRVLPPHDGISKSKPERVCERCTPTIRSAFATECPLGLPPKVFKNIVNRLDSKDLCRASQVCSYWYRLCSLDSIWKPLVLEDFPDEQFRSPRGESVSWKREFAYRWTIARSTPINILCVGATPGRDELLTDLVQRVLSSNAQSGTGYGKETGSRLHVGSTEPPFFFSIVRWGGKYNIWNWDVPKRRMGEEAPWLDVHPRCVAVLESSHAVVLFYNPRDAETLQRVKDSLDMIRGVKGWRGYRVALIATESFSDSGGGYGVGGSWTGCASWGGGGLEKMSMSVSSNEAVNSWGGRGKDILGGSPSSPNSSRSRLSSAKQRGEPAAVKLSALRECVSSYVGAGGAVYCNPNVDEALKDFSKFLIKRPPSLSFRPHKKVEEPAV